MTCDQAPDDEILIVGFGREGIGGKKGEFDFREGAEICDFPNIAS